MDERLKPCAHCGYGIPTIDHTSDSLFDCGIYVYWVVCPKCGIRTQRNRDNEEVIKAWNRRMGEQDD
jgi:Lar family restriction alleviation protein